MRHSHEWLIWRNDSFIVTPTNEWVVQCYSSRVTHMTESLICETAPCVTQHPASFCFQVTLFLAWRRFNLTQLNHWTQWFGLETIIDFPFGFFPINNIISLWITRPSGWCCAFQSNHTSPLQNIVFFHRALLQKRSIILSILSQWVVRIPKWKRLYSAKETYDLRIPIKSYVSFAEYSLFHRTLLQKRPIILSIFPQWVVRTSSTPSRSTPSLSHGV